ncbi:hypothetical protein JW935_01890 [candidate division KSB1 bacterium]|nr:hypothetical protein [candidate division KSB1 bacterium]
MKWSTPGLMPMNAQKLAYGACGNGTVNVDGDCTNGLTNSGTEKCQAGGQAGKKCQSGAAAQANCITGTSPYTP